MSSRITFLLYCVLSFLPITGFAASDGLLSNTKSSATSRILLIIPQALSPVYDTKLSNNSITLASNLCSGSTLYSYENRQLGGANSSYVIKEKGDFCSQKEKVSTGLLLISPTP